MNKYEQALKQLERVPGVLDVLEIDENYGVQDSKTRDDYLADIQDILKSFKGEKGKDDLKKLHNELKTMVERWSTDWTINRDQMIILTDLVFNQIVEAGKNIDKNFEQSLTESPKKKSGGLRSPFAALREKLKNAKNKDPVVVEVGRVAEETTVFVELYDPSQNPRLSVELDSLSDDSIELSTDVEKTKADPEKKKTTLKSLSTLRESISKKLKSSFAEKASAKKSDKEQAKKSSVADELLKQVIKASNQKEGSPAAKKTEDQINKLINKASREDVMEAERLIDKALFSANPPAGVKDKSSFKKAAQNVLTKISTRLETNESSKNKSVDRVKFNDRFKGISTRFRKVAKEAENLSSNNQSTEEKAEIALIQQKLDAASKSGTQALSLAEAIMDPDDLSGASAGVEVLSESVEAADQASVVASSKKWLNSESIQNFKKAANDVGARIREKLFPFQGTLEKLANKHALASGEKKKKIEATIDKLINSNNDWLHITRVLRNLVAKNDDRLTIVRGKLELKATALDPIKEQTRSGKDESFATADFSDSSDLEGLENPASRSPNPDESLDTADITYTSDIHELRAIIEDLAAMTEAKQSAQVPREKQVTKELPQVQILVEALVEKAKTFVKKGDANVVKDFQNQAKELIRNVLNGKIDPEIIKMAVAKIRDEKNSLGNDASRASLFDGLGNIVSALQSVVPPPIPPKPVVQPRVPKFAQDAKKSARTAAEEGKARAQDEGKEPPVKNN